MDADSRDQRRRWLNVKEAAKNDGPNPQIKHASAAATDPLGTDMQLITLHVPKGMLKQFDDVVKAKQYPNRSEAIRLAMHDLIHTEGVYS